jgi:hypothetical protein
MSGLKKIIFWGYERGTLQYDTLCGLILLFIFATPRWVFQDWPLINSPHQFVFGEQIVNTFDHRGNPVLNVSTELVPPNQDASALRHSAASQLQRTLNKPVTIADIKPILGENGETIGYSIWLGQENSTTF